MLTRAGFVRIACQIAHRASGWAFDVLIPSGKLDEPMSQASAARFTATIREMCDWIDEDADPASRSTLHAQSGERTGEVRRAGC